jgi:hypothetical protein
MTPNSLNNRMNAMYGLAYIIAILLIVIWAIGFFVLSLGAAIHLLLIIAGVTILFRVIRGHRVKE